MSGFILVLNKPDNNSSDYITALLQLHTLRCGSEAMKCVATTSSQLLLLKKTAKNIFI